MKWIPIAIFVALGVLFFDKALRRRARRTWAWGRSGGRVELSRRSYGVLGLVFFTIAWIVARAPEPGWIAAAAIGLCVFLMIGSGFADTHAHRKSRAASTPNETTRDPLDT